jgi:CDP-diacylglycerol--glycerol-3-phosphate 3-phosphatidyltransferase
MLTDRLRKLFQPLLDWLAPLLARSGISPNQLTLVGLGLNLVVAAVLATGHLRWGGALILLVNLLDALDGALARHNGVAGGFGAFLDSTVDRYSEAALFTALLWHFLTTGARQEAILASVALFGGLAVSYTRARAEGLGLKCTEGVFTRVERVVVLAIGLLAGLPLATLWILAIFSHLTALQRILYVRRQFAAQGQAKT